MLQNCSLVALLVVVDIDQFPEPAMDRDATEVLSINSVIEIDETVQLWMLLLEVGEPPFDTAHM